MNHTTRTREILSAYAAGDRSFTSLDLDEEVHDFSNTLLTGADFTGSFICASFRGADLKRAIFKNTNVKTCDFSNANLAGASFEDAVIDGAVFAGANLDGALFLGASEQGHTYKSGELPV